MPARLVRVDAADGRFLAWGAYSPASMIRVRAWSFDEAERIDRAFFQRRSSGHRPAPRLPIASDGVRLVHGEADGLPGPDRRPLRRHVLSAQFLSAGAERWRDTLADAAAGRHRHPACTSAATPACARWKAWPERSGWLRGDGDPAVTITEHAWQLTLDVAQGHKTGFYLDQRDNRARFADWVRHFGLPRVLNCYCYTGGFSVAALAGGATDVTSVDSSAPALARAQAHVRAERLRPGHATVDADVNQLLRDRLAAAGELRRHRARPAEVRAHGRPCRARGPRLQGHQPPGAEAAAAGRAAADLQLLRRHRAELFHKIVAGAGMDAGVDAAILQRLEGACDHPTTLSFPKAST
jgi:23S rRNA (cytosine1962-C5)-methyltransferase